MILGFTGTRQGTTDAQRELIRVTIHECAIQAEFSKAKLVFAHGGAEGADFEAHWIAGKSGKVSQIVIYPAKRAKIARKRFEGKGMLSEVIWKPEDEPLKHNGFIVAECSSLLACPAGYEEELRSGTWATIRLAQKKEKRIIIIWPNGARQFRHLSASVLESPIK